MKSTKYGDKKSKKCYTYILRKEICKKKVNEKDPEKIQNRSESEIEEQRGMKQDGFFGDKYIKRKEKGRDEEFGK